MGGEGLLKGLLEAMYYEDTLAIDANGEIGGFIKLTRGVKQGCILSPLHFNIFISDLGKELEKSPGIQMGSTKKSSLLFADDLLILGRTNEEINEKIRVLQVWCKENKMEINFDKTKI